MIITVVVATAGNRPGGSTIAVSHQRGPSLISRGRWRRTRARELAAKVRMRPPGPAEVRALIGPTERRRPAGPPEAWEPPGPAEMRGSAGQAWCALEAVWPGVELSRAAPTVRKPAMEAMETIQARRQRRLEPASAWAAESRSTSG